MKSLVESLFDTNLATKNIKFGDLFEFRCNTPFKTKAIIESFCVDALKHDMKIKGSDKFEVIIKGLRKIIENIPVIGSENSAQLCDKIKPLVKPYIASQYLNNSYMDPYIVGVRDDSKQNFGDIKQLNNIESLAIFLLSKIGLFYKKR